MLERDIDAALVNEFFEYILDAEVREAFIYLVGAFTCLRSVTWRVKKQGFVRSFRVYQDGKRYFSMMPSQHKINFHFLPPVLRDSIYRKDAISKMFSSFDDSSHKDEEHWAIDIKTIEDARLLLRALNLK